VIQNPARLAPSQCLVAIHEQIKRVVEKTHPVVCAVESVIYLQNYKTAITLGAARGVALLAVAQAGLPIHEYAPRRIKSAATGHGGAQKGQVGFMMRALLGLRENPPPDAADALAAADLLQRLMITYLQGKLAHVWPTQAIIDVNGVGYELLIPLSTYDKLPAPPAPVKLLTYLQVREDAHILYGFATPDERDLFRLLINHVTGIGPKTALAVLSGATSVQFKGAVVAGNLEFLSKIKGVGKKTAERIVVELRDKVGVSAAWEAASAAHDLSPEERHGNDAMLALISLGYKQVDAHKAVRAVRDRTPQASVEELIREALKLV
jgi:holliday junction DNA helicase RuvA